jgi:hypothetical protein
MPRSVLSEIPPFVGGGSGCSVIESMQRFLRQAKDSNANATRTASGSLIVRQGAKYKVLANKQGVPTKAGRFWERLTGSALPPPPPAPEAAPVRKGNREYLQEMGGKERLLRTYDPAKNEWKYTRAGLPYYRRVRLQYVVKVPSRHAGKRSNGRDYTRDGFYPLDTPISLPMTLNREQRDAQIRQAVAEMFPDGLLAEFSGEEIKIDAARAWQITEMITTPGADGAPPRASVTDRPLGARPASLSTLLFPEHVCPVAFEDHPDRLCAARQIAHLAGLDLEEVCAELDQLEENIYGTSEWRVKGCTSRMIALWAQRHDRGSCCLHGDRVVETTPGPQPLCWAIHEGHAYFYSDKRICKKLAGRTPAHKAQHPRMHCAPSKPSATPPFEEWAIWCGAENMAPGKHYYSDDLDSVRCQLMASGRVPKLSLKDECSLRALHHTFPGKRGSCVIHAVPLDWEKVRDFVRSFGLDYRGEGLPGATWKIVQHLVCKKQRRWLTGEEKHAVLAEHNFRCAACGTSGKFEFDHVHALSTSFGEQRFQPLCVSCHRTKTAEEPKEPAQHDALASHFNQEAWDSYVLSRRPPPLICKTKEALKGDLEDRLEGCLHSDVQRCRTRALLYNTHEIAIFCPLDSPVERTECLLGDLNFVTLPYRCCVKQLGYTGPGWQHRVQTEWLLYAGVLDWQYISYTFTATGRAPADLFSEALQEVERAAPDLSKLGVNSMIGLWAIDREYSYRVVSSSREDDCPETCTFKRIFTYADGERYVTDYVTKTEIVKTTSLRPLHDLTLCHEAMRVGQMLYCLKRQQAAVYELKTDSVLYRPRKRARVVLPEVAVRTQVRDLFESTLPGQLRLDQRFTPAVHPSEEVVYRVSTALPEHLLASSAALRPRQDSLCFPELAWTDLTEAEAEQAVVDGQSLLVLGMPGVGKTTLCRTLHERLQALQKNIAVISKTHAAAVRAGGCTADHFVRKYLTTGSCNVDAIWVDECFQIECGLWAQLQKLKGRQWILSGDEHQFGPIFDTWKGANPPALYGSRFLWHLCGGRRLVLTECRRSETELFNFYRSLTPGGARYEAPLPQVLEECRQRFSLPGFCRHNLCISHAKRVQINRLCNEHFKPPDAVLVKAPKRTKGQLCAPQNMWLWPGIELLGCSWCSKKIKNNVLYTVTSLDAAAQTLCVEGDAAHTLSFEQATTVLRLSFARTYASVQGQEFSESLALHDTRSKHFTRTHLYVALSRAKQAGLIAVRN